MISAETYNADYEKVVKFGYNKAVDEFSENLKSEIMEEIYDIAERQRNYEVENEMSVTHSHIMGL